MDRYFSLWLGLLLAGTAAPAAAQMNHGATMESPACALLSAPSLGCSTTVTPTFDRSGKLWLAWTWRGGIYVNGSSDQGATFSPPIKVASPDAALDDGGDSRPKIVIVEDRSVIVTYTIKGASPYSGVVMVARSEDGGRTFLPSTPISDEATPTSQRFEAISLDKQNRLTIVWLDKRDRTLSEGKRQPGAALYMAQSEDGGRNFGPNHRLAGPTCECCRVAMAPDTDGSPIVVWRALFAPNIRDHVLGRIGSKGMAPPTKISEDMWALDACPHHGPSVSVAANGVYDVTWYTGGERRKGVFYSRSDDGGKSFSPPMAVGGESAAHPQVLSQGKVVFLAWKEFRSGVSHARVMSSEDGGRSWSAPRTAATAANASDLPVLLGDGKWAYLSWKSLEEGYRLVQLGPVAVNGEAHP